MRKLLDYFLFCLLWLPVACTFTLDEPSGITKEITPITPTGTISLTDYIGKDTIYLYSNKTFTFDIRDDLSGSEFKGEAYFDNTLFYNFNTRQGQFSLPYGYLKTGYHKLKLSFKEPLNDKSLITNFKNLEATIFKEWVLVIDVDPPPSFKVITSAEGGYLKYTWPEYKKPNFVSYELAIYSDGPYKRLMINDPSKNFFVDSTYIDGGVNSYVQVSINALGSASAYGVADEPPIKLNMVFHPEDTTARFVWSKPKYYGALKSYTISDDRATLANITVASDTAINIKIDGAFPAVTRTMFKMFSQSGKEAFEAVNDINFFIGNAMPIATTYGQFWFYSQAANKYIARYGPTIGIYDASFNLLTTRSILTYPSNSMTVSWPGNFLHYINTAYEISQFDLVNNSETSMPIMGDSIPAYVSAVSGTSTQVVSFYAFDNDHVHTPKDIYGLVNMQNSTILHQDNASAWTVISDDGRYSVGRPKVYSVSGGTQSLIGAIPSNLYFHWFRGDNTDEIITTQYSGSVDNELKTVIIQSADLSILRSFDTPEAGYILSCYDPSTQTLLYTKSGATKVYLINIDTGAKKIFKAYGNFNTPLVNGIIIIGSRYIKAL